MIALLHVLFVAFLVVAFPIWDRVETKRLKQDPSSARRVLVYKKTIAWLWAGALMLVATVPWASLNQPPVVPWIEANIGRDSFWPILGGLSVGMFVPLILAWRSEAARSRIVKQMDAFAFFLPQNATERWWFVAVSISAGVCEEIIFRGFLIAWIAQLPGVTAIVAVLLAAVVFGVDHGYQGWTGILMTGFMALMLTLIFIISGSLWLPMLVHALVDLRVVALLSLPVKKGDIPN